MNKISCDVCMDLIPLVKDGIASQDSKELVEAHISGCDECNRFFDGEIKDDVIMDDAAVLGKIRKKMTYFILGIMLVGTLFGMLISNSMNLFYNALIMPAIGALGFVLLKRKAYVVPGGLFIFSFFWVLIRELFSIVHHFTEWYSVVLMASWWAAIFAVFCLIGVFIADLLYYVFRKEV